MVTTTVTVAHPTPHAKRHLDRSSRFATIHPRDQRQTHKQTDRQTMNIAKYRSHLYATHIRCGLKTIETASDWRLVCEQKTVDDAIDNGDDVSRTMFLKRDNILNIFWTSNVASPVLTFSGWMAKHFMTVVVVSWYSNAEVRVFWYTVKFLLWN